MAVGRRDSGSRIVSTSLGQWPVPVMAAAAVPRRRVGEGRVRLSAGSAVRPLPTLTLRVQPDLGHSDGHQGQTYELSGDVPWSYEYLAAALGEVLGRDVVHRSLSSEQHLQALLDVGLPEPMAQMVVGVDAGIRAGAFAFTNGDLAHLLGRPTTT